MIVLVPSHAYPIKHCFITEGPPLKEDIRFLGRILGDVISDQEGGEVFYLVETIRKNLIAYLHGPIVEENMMTDPIMNRLITPPATGGENKPITACVSFVPLFDT